MNTPCQKYFKKKLEHFYKCPYLHLDMANETKRIVVEVTPVEHQLLKEALVHEKISISDWLRRFIKRKIKSKLDK